VTQPTCDRPHHRAIFAKTTTPILVSRTEQPHRDSVVAHYTDDAVPAYLPRFASRATRVTNMGRSPLQHPPPPASDIPQRTSMPLVTHTTAYHARRAAHCLLLFSYTPPLPPPPFASATYARLHGPDTIHRTRTRTCTARTRGGRMAFLPGALFADLNVAYLGFSGWL